MTVLPIKDARSMIGKLVREAATNGTRTYISDHGTTSAVILSVREVQDLEDTNAVLELKLREAGGEKVPTYSLADVRAELGL